jgi:hypothetical protein
MEFVRKIGRGAFFKMLSIELVDGSTYTDVEVAAPELKFLSLAGVQTVDLSEIGCDMRGQTPEDVRQLRDDLMFALSHNLDAVIRTVGKDVFEKYFYSGTTARQLPPKSSPTTAP